MKLRSRSKIFSQRTDPRYWWHSGTGTDYVPDVYSILTRSEWKILSRWFSETDAKYGPGTGECSVPAISALLSLINGNGISRTVQLGHFVGYSSMMIGMCLRRMDQGLLVSIDIDPNVTAFTQKYLEKARLTEFVDLIVGDSADKVSATKAIKKLGGNPQLIFIDSAHTASHTLAELETWYELLEPGGLIVLHDASKFSERWDSTHEGGVQAGLSKYADKRILELVSINKDFGGNEGQGRENLTYLDGCGLAVIYKPLQ